MARLDLHVLGGGWLIPVTPDSSGPSSSSIQTVLLGIVGERLQIVVVQVQTVLLDNHWGTTPDNSGPSSDCINCWIISGIVGE